MFRPFFAPFSLLLLATACRGLGQRQIGLRLKKVPKSLGAGYAVGALGLRAVSPTPEAFTACAASVWSGFVLAISFMEAPVKFRAPFLPRLFAIDVGRTVFPALNVVESVLCAAVWLLGTRSLALAIATVALVAQVSILTPILAARGQSYVLEQLEKHPYLIESVLTESQRERYNDIREAPKKESQSSGRGSPTIHLAYAFCELVKLAMLVRVALTASQGVPV